MKKILSAILACALILCAATSCDITVYDGELTVVIGTQTPEVYTLEYKGEDITNGLLSVLDLLEIQYTESSGFLYSVGNLNPVAPTYIYIYTSVAADADVTTYATTMEYEGVTLTSTGVGASQMHIEDGAIIYIGTITYEW